MAHIPYKNPQDADLIMRAGFELAEKRFGFLLHVVQAMAHCPDLASPLLSFIGRILRDGRIDWLTKELAILKTTRAQECEYCVVQHTNLSERLGISRKKINALWGDLYKSSPLFDERERAVIELASQMTVNANKVSKELIERLKQHFDTPQLVELCLTIAAYSMVSKFGDALGLELEEIYQGEEAREAYEYAMSVSEQHPVPAEEA